MIKVVLVDDHVLLRNALASVINSFDGCRVIFEADNGKHFIELLKKNEKPDIVLLDITMPEMNGFATAEWVKKNESGIKLLTLTMMDDEDAVIRMLQNGAKGYILKDSKPAILKTAIHDIINKGFYFNETVTGKLIHFASQKNEEHKSSHLAELTEKETEFLKLCCTEKSYKLIADSMNITTRAVEALRSTLFAKLKTENRVGLVLYAIRNGLVKIV